MGSPASVPRPVLVFDGDCGFCTSSARFAQRWCRVANVEPWQRLDLASVGLTAEACTEAVQFVEVDGTVRSAEHAIVAALGHGARPCRLVGRILALPGVRSLAGQVYRQVARHRHRLPGGTPACRL